MSVENLITKHIDIWTSAVQTKSTVGRGTSSKLDLYGIKKLRELILELAVRGKITIGLDFKGSAKDVIKNATNEKSVLAKKRKIRADKEVYSTALIHDFPPTWETVCIGQVAHVLGGKRVPKGCKLLEQPTDFVYLRVTDMKNQSIDESDLRYIPEDVFEQISRYTINSEDVYVTIAGTIGAVGSIPSHLDGMSLTENAAKLVFGGISKEYLIVILQSSFVKKQFDEAVNQMAQPKLSLNSIKHTLIPIPSLEEQNYIVAKVDELMAFCDQLEQQTETNIEAHRVLVESLLATLTNSANSDELMENWERISAHFDTLFTTEESIDQLKQTILQLAVMGKLVPQNPKDEPASVLLERIAKEKAQLVKDKKIKKQKALPPITGDEKPFELPNGWEWCRTVDAGDIKLGRQRSPKDHTGPYMTPYLRVANVHDNRIDTTDIKKMNFTPEEQKIFRLEYGDILLNEGQSKELVGRPAIYRDEVPGACFQNTLLRFKVWEGVSAEYSLLYFRYCLYSGRFQRAVKQTTNMAHLSAARLIPIEFPLPPKEEQARIVAKVNELTGICEQLKVCLKESQSTQLHLTDAIVEQAV